MPLKHATETLLTAILALAIIAAGILAALLPALPGGILPWSLALFASIAYPVALYPLFRERRADYPFRVLHFLPAVILLTRLVLGLLASKIPSLDILERLFTWGWSFPPVFASLLSLVWFCLKVIRQRAQRLAALGAMFLPFLAASVVLPLFMRVPTSGPLIVGQVTSSVSSQASSVSTSETTDEKWLIEQKRMQRRTERLAQLQRAPQSVHSAVIGMMTSFSSQMSSTSVANPPPHLSSSGPGTEALIITLIGVYCAVLHQRAKKRTDFLRA